MGKFRIISETDLGKITFDISMPAMVIYISDMTTFGRTDIIEEQIRVFYDWSSRGGNSARGECKWKGLLKWL